MPDLATDELVRLLLASTGEGIYGIDLTGSCTFANPACLRLLGYERDTDLLGRNMHDLVHHTRPDGTPYPERECRIFRALREDQGAHVDDEVLFRADGSAFPVEYWSYPVFQEDRRVGCVVTFVDITERRASERRVEEQARQLAEMARFPEMNPGPVCRLDRAGTIVLANAAARRVFGDEALLGRHWLDVCPGMTPARWDRVLAADAHVHHEAEVAGRHFVFAHTPGTEGSEIFAYGTDLTEQRAAERALRQSERMATLGTLAAGVAHELNNPAAAAQRSAHQLAEAFAGLQHFELRLDQTVLSPEEREALAALDVEVRERAACGCDSSPMERSDRENALEEWLEGRGVADPWELAPALAAMNYTPDELSALETTFRAEHLPSVAEWLSRTYPVYSLLEEIRHAAGRLSEIVVALKAYSYVGQAPVQAVDVNEGIRHTLIILRNKLKQGVEVVQELATDLPRIQAYGGDLNQVWTNLIDNAAAAMQGRGRLVVRSRHENDHVVVEVEDDGPGIPGQVQPRIFDAFYTTKAPGEGTGLGLHTCYTIVVKRHGGRIAVDSRPGCTRFVVALRVDGVPATTQGGGDPR